MTKIEVLNMSPIHGQGHYDIVDRAVQAAVARGWNQSDPSTDGTMKLSLGNVTFGSNPVNGARVSVPISDPTFKI